MKSYITVTPLISLGGEFVESLRKKGFKLCHLGMKVFDEKNSIDLITHILTERISLKNDDLPLIITGLNCDEGDIATVVNILTSNGYSPSFVNLGIFASKNNPDDKVPDVGLARAHQTRIINKCQELGLEVITARSLKFEKAN